MYPEAVSPVPTENGFNGQSLDRASSIGEIPYESQDTNGFVSNGYTNTTTNGESVAASPTPYTTNEYNGNGYTGYNENGSIVSTNGNENTVSACNENGSTVNGYTGNGYNGNGMENSGTQFVRRRLLPAIPKGETLDFVLFFFFVFI